MTTRTLCHYTITSGHSRQSPRSEVRDDVIAELAPLLCPGNHPMPAPAGGYRLRVTIDGSTMAATVTTGSGIPLATTIVCVDQAGLDAALRATGMIPATEISLPCALVEIHPTLALDPDASGWLGDFERCIAWAWIEQAGRA